MNDVDRISPDQLHLDLRNPRMPEREFRNEEDVLTHLIQNYDIDELVLSIMSAGWLDFEPFIVLRDEKVVLEGNRRLAALKLIRDGELRKTVGYEIPSTAPTANGPKGVSPTDPNLQIPVRFVSARTDAYVFLGFKHINGPYKWKSLAKAKFASDWLDNGAADVASVSRMLGDSHNTVVRLVNGWRVLKRAEKEGFDPRAISGYELAISHIYTALPRPSVRSYLGITSSPSEVIKDSDIPKEKAPNLLQLMSWIYGQEPKQRAVVKTQNPDLNTLIRVLGSDNALAELRATNDLQRAETQLTPAAQRFDLALRAAAQAMEHAEELASDYDGDPVLLNIVNNIGKTVINTRKRMQEIIDKQKPVDPLAALSDESDKP
ncbi:hypothetical protein [Azospirillum largimobile]